jgi:hypothetical protein
MYGDEDEDDPLNPIEDAAPDMEFAVPESNAVMLNDILDDNEAEEGIESEDPSVGMTHEDGEKFDAPLVWVLPASTFAFLEDLPLTPSG